MFIETPANPTNAMVDLALIKEVVDAYETENGHRPLIVCDNTMLGPVFQNPLQHGVDLVAYSLTKYIGGHSDLVAGGVIGRQDLSTKVRGVRSAYGSQLDPHSAWMIGRSLETLSLRMERSAESALKVARWLQDNPHQQVDVQHPEFIDKPGFLEVRAFQTSGAGSTFSVVLKDRAAAFKVINGLSIFKSAVSLGGTESLVCHPASTTHSGVSEDIRAAVGVSEGLIRISIGLEHPDDLIADLNAALQ